MEEDKRIQILDNRLAHIENNVAILKTSLTSLKEVLEESFVIDDQIVGKDEIDNSLNQVESIINHF